MRLLFDHGTPAPLRRALTGHSVSTAYEMGWTELDNGALLRAAESDFDVLITTDRNLRYQQPERPTVGDLGVADDELAEDSGP